MSGALGGLLSGLGSGAGAGGGGGGSGTSVDSEAGTGQMDFGANFGDARIQVQAPIINFGGTVHPASLENGGDERGIPPQPNWQWLPGATFDGRYSTLSGAGGAIPVSYGGGIQPAFFDTYNNTGPLAGFQLSGIAIAAVAAIGLGALLYFKKGAR